MSEEKVLTNPDLLREILNFSGIKILKYCDECKIPIKYQKFNQIVYVKHIQYTDMGICRKKNFCDKQCVQDYKIKHATQHVSIVIFLIILTVSITEHCTYHAASSQRHY